MSIFNLDVVTHKTEVHKMKTLVYTCNDLRHSTPCVDLLYSSLMEHNEKGSFDFAVLCDDRNHERVDYEVLYDYSYPPQFTGSLRYSSLIPKGYDYYLYLDSDILFYDKIENVLPVDGKCVNAVWEGQDLMYKSCWHNHGFEEKITPSDHDKPCINSGQFSFTGQCDLLSQVRDNMMSLPIFADKDHNYPVHECAMYEQSSFNYTLLGMWNDVDFHRMTNRVSLRPESETNFRKTVFHFNGFHEGMTRKHHRMCSFAQHYKSKFMSV